MFILFLTLKLITADIKTAYIGLKTKKTIPSNEFTGKSGKVKKFNGIIRNIMADSFLLTFNNINDLINAISFIMIEWEKLCENNN